MELKVGMYVRTKNLGIEKIINVFDKNYLMNICGRIQTKNYGLDEEDILKASHNIIDLIEVGDYVNGYKVYYCYCADEDSTGLFFDTEKGRQWLDKPRQVKSIVTKEQFESMSYKVGD